MSTDGADVTLRAPPCSQPHTDRPISGRFASYFRCGANGPSLAWAGQERRPSMAIRQHVVFIHTQNTSLALRLVRLAPRLQGVTDHCERRR